MELEQKNFLGGRRAFLGEEGLPKFRIATSGMRVINTCGVYEDYDNLLEGYYCPTLKDLAIFLYQMCGQGVHKQLSREISKRTGIRQGEIDDVLVEIISEYAKMSDEEAMKDWETKEKFETE